MPSLPPADLFQRVRTALESAPNAMFLQLARRLGAPEEQVVRALPEGWATELDIGRWEELIRRLADLGEVHVIVTNGAATLESVGRFGGFSVWEEFFNVQTPTLDMHIRWPNLGAAFALVKPSHMTGKKTLSIQFFDGDGHAAFKVFLTLGTSEPSEERRRAFESLRVDFAVGRSRGE
ncbi:MAG: ChuX/HutX family heme-like substrate-binding protein [Gemmataceae bacterium]